MSDEKIIIKNKNIADYVMFKSDKLENEFTTAELNQVSELVINYDEEIESSFEFLEELAIFKMLKTLTIRHGYIFNDNFNIFLELENINELVFENCEFENADLIASLSVKSLSLINCKINDYKFVYIMENLEQLSIVNGSIEISKINKLNNLAYLQISYSNLIGIENEINLINLKELYVDNTNILNLLFINNLTNLKRLSIDEKQYEKNQVLVDKLISNGVLVLNENMVDFRGENNEF